MAGEHQGDDFINLYPEKPMSDMTDEELDAIAMQLVEWARALPAKAARRDTDEPYVPIPGVSPAINALGAEAWAKHPERRARWRAEREALAEELKRKEKPHAGHGEPGPADSQ